MSDTVGDADPKPPNQGEGERWRCAECGTKLTPAQQRCHDPAHLQTRLEQETQARRQAEAREAKVEADLQRAAEFRSGIRGRNNTIDELTASLDQAEQARVEAEEREQQACDEINYWRRRAADAEADNARLREGLRELIEVDATGDRCWLHDDPGPTAGAILALLTNQPESGDE